MEIVYKGSLYTNAAKTHSVGYLRPLSEMAWTCNAGIEVGIRKVPFATVVGEIADAEVGVSVPGFQKQRSIACRIKFLIVCLELIMHHLRNCSKLTLELGHNVRD